MAADLAYLDSVLFQRGAHWARTDESPVCVREALNRVVYGKHKDDLLNDYPELGGLHVINDSVFWKTPEARTAFLKPFVTKFLHLPKSAELSVSRMKRMAEAAIHCVLLIPKREKVQPWDVWAYGSDRSDYACKFAANAIYSVASSKKNFTPYAAAYAAEGAATCNNFSPISSLYSARCAEYAAAYAGVSPKYNFTAILEALTED